MIPKLFFSTLLFCLGLHTLVAQDYYRFKADFSIKEKTVGDEKGLLITGTVYFDKNTKKVCHDIRFPSRERWLNQDTMMYKVVNDTLASKRSTIAFGEFSIYNMILTQQIHDFGMNSGGFDLKSVEEDAEGQTVSTWEPKPEIKELVGKLILVQKDKKVTAVAFYKPEGDVQGKFYFKDYQTIQDLPVPTKIYQIFYLKDGKEYNRIITYKNVVINEQGADEAYDFKLPDLK